MVIVVVLGRKVGSYLLLEPSSLYNYKLEDGVLAHAPREQAYPLNMYPVPHWKQRLLESYWMQPAIGAMPNPKLRVVELFGREAERGFGAGRVRMAVMRKTDIRMFMRFYNPATSLRTFPNSVYKLFHYPLSTTTQKCHLSYLSTRNYIKTSKLKFLRFIFYKYILRISHKSISLLWLWWWWLDDLLYNNMFLIVHEDKPIF